MIEEIMRHLQMASKTEMMLNILIFNDFGKWKQEEIKTFIEFINEMTDTKEQNLVYKCYNPILVICLCCEFLMKIGNAISNFKHEGAMLSQDLQSLGEKLIEGMDSKIIERIFMDTDFKDRTVLKHITDYGYEPLLRDDKASALLDELWVDLKDPQVLGLPRPDLELASRVNLRHGDEF